ncbi:MAG: hypothetical protein JWO76_3195 [Nocardioides sp.]|nr:hypothetical protein [Nocardioides sp.]
MKFLGTRSVVTLLCLLSSGAMLQLTGASAANATVSCFDAGTGQNKHEHCDGLHDEYLGSKFTGTADFWDGTIQNQETQLLINGSLKDKVVDGNCTWMRAFVKSNYWPDGNYLNDPKWKNCNDSKALPVGMDLHGAWTYPGAKIEIQHCQEFGAQQDCTTFFTRKVPG